MRRPTRWEVGTVAGFLLVYTVISLFAKPGAALTAFSDMSGAGLWLIAVVVLLWAGFGNRGRTRWFWFLMAFGAALVGTNFAAWLYYEVITGREPPNPFWADIPLFLQPVPMMAAAAMRPGSRQREQKFLLSTLNFLILLLWWVYLYMFLVYPNEYIVMDQAVYNTYYFSLFVVEFAVLIWVLAVLSLPLIGLWVLLRLPEASGLRPFRVTVTLIGIMLVAVCVFLRQMLLAQEMTRLLGESKQNLERLQLAQSQLVQQERLAGIGQLVSGVAHELNNPLTAVVGYSDLLKEQAKEADARQKLERLGSEARRMKKIIDNLISFARPLQNGRKPLDISTVLRDSLMLCEYQWKSAGIHFELNLAANLPRIAINEGQFKMVFVNLFTNAAQAVEQAAEKKVVVEGSLEAKKIVLRFRDTGPGFRDLDRVFDPFYTTKPIGQGTGLGLSMCYGTVREHNGNIYAQNLYPHGAAVTIELPAV